jgi:nucleotide-binding universal stress UspA family protein
MGPIVCATRGGEASRHSQERAIALAGERGVPLIFLFVADITAIRPGNPTLGQALLDELEGLGRRLLSIAQARAKEQGIIAAAAVRRGAVRYAIEDFLREVQASALVLGAPRTGSEKKAFAPRELSHFAQDIHASTGVEVIVVD